LDSLHDTSQKLSLKNIQPIKIPFPGPENPQWPVEVDVYDLHDVTGKKLQVRQARENEASQIMTAHNQENKRI
jgi:hypothetical protein